MKMKPLPFIVIAIPLIYVLFNISTAFGKTDSTCRDTKWPPPLGLDKRFYRSAKGDWQECYQLCYTATSRLATIDDDKQLKKVLQLISSSGEEHMVWICGLHLSPLLPFFCTTSNDLTMPYRKWGWEQPQNIKGEYCISVLRSENSLFMHDYPCDRSADCLCERYY